MAKYTIEAASEWGLGQSANGYGKRARVHGFYVVNESGRRVCAFQSKVANDPAARKQAEDWAAHLEGHGI